MSFYHSRLDSPASCLYHVTMRIGMLADAYKPHISGITIYMDTYRAALEADGHEVYIFTLGNRREPGDDEHVVRSPGLPLPQRGYYVTLGYSRSARELLGSMDIVHVHHPFTSGRIALRYCRPHNIPIVFTNHTRYDLYARSYARLVPPALIEMLLRWYMPRFCSAIQLVISPAPSIVKVLRAFGVTSPIEVVPNAVDMQRIYNARPLHRADLGFRDDDILLAFTGRLAAEKNLLFLVQAFAQAAKVNPKAHLVLIGDGHQRRALTSLATQLGIADRVHFTGQVPYDQIPAFITTCDAFVTASITEVRPLSIIEAMGAGLPVVGIESPGVSDTVEDGRTGFLATPQVDDFADKLTRLLLDPDLRARMGDAARRASAAYDIRHTKQIILGHYQRLVDESRLKRGRA